MATLIQIVQSSTSTTEIQTVSMVAQNVLASAAADIAAGTFDVTAFTAATSEAALIERVESEELPGTIEVPVDTFEASPPPPPVVASPGPAK